MLPILQTYSGADFEEQARMLLERASETGLPGGAGASAGSSGFAYCLVLPRADRTLAHVLLHERSDAERARFTARRLLDCLGRLHASGLVHGDVKPLNCVRLGDEWRLIDLDASAPLGAPIGLKSSAAYCPPEALYRDSDGRWRIRAVDESGVALDPDERGAFEPLPAGASFDLWSFGCLLYTLLARRPLWNADRDDNLDQGQMAALGTWGADPGFVSEALAAVPSPLGRALLAQLLHPDPSARLQSVAAVLADPFFTAQHVAGEEAPPLPAHLRWHFFISHSQGHAGDACMSLKYAVEKAVPGVRVWFDQDENPSEAGMLEGVRGSRVFLLFLTQGVLKRPWVQFEVREALRLGKPVVLVEETDPRHHAAGAFNDYLAECPEDMRPIFNSVSIKWMRERSYRRERQTRNGTVQCEASCCA